MNSGAKVKSSSTEIQEVLTADLRISSKIYKCSDCAYETIMKKNFMNHLQAKHSMQQPLEGLVSLYSCGIKQNLGYPNIPAKNNSRHKPSPCNYQSATKQSVGYHIKSMNPYKCSKCDYECALKNNLEDHIRTQHLMKQFKCSFCDFSSPSKFYLNNHMKSKHSSNKAFKCKKCSYSTCDKEGLAHHMKVNHTAKNDSYKCEECSFSTTSLQNLVGHQIRKHSAYKPYTCRECNYHASSHSSLAAHTERKHAKEAMLNCPSCDCKTPVKKNLSCDCKTPVKKNLSCDCKTPVKKNLSCDCKTPVKKNLESHISEQHSALKDYACVECGYGSSTMKEFMATHKREHKRKLHSHFKSGLLGKSIDVDAKFETVPDDVLTEYEEQYETQPGNTSHSNC